MTSIEAQTQTEAIYTCQRCGRPSTNSYMCDACWELSAPRKLKPGQQWHEPPTNRGWRRRERREEKRAAAWEKAIAAIKDIDEGELNPGWTARLRWKVEEFYQQERRHGERLEWLDQTWLRQIDVRLWRESLLDQDATYQWQALRQIDSEKYVISKNGTLSMADDIHASDNRFGNRMSDPKNPDVNQRRIENGVPVTWLIREDDIDADGYEDYEQILQRRRDLESLNQYSLDRFFADVMTLPDEHFAVLQVYIHQQRAHRTHQSQLACTSSDAAKILSTRLGKDIKAAAYRKRVERMKEALGRDIDVFIKYRLL